MKTARVETTRIVGRVEVEAGPGAPARGACPACGEPVALQRHSHSDPRAGGWYYFHTRGTGRDCPLRATPMGDGDGRRPLLVRGSPELTLAIRIVSVVAEAAEEGDADALAWLAEHPLPQLTLLLLDIDPDVAVARLAARVQRGAAKPQMTNDQ